MKWRISTRLWITVFWLTFLTKKSWFKWLCQLAVADKQVISQWDTLKYINSGSFMVFLQSSVCTSKARHHIYTQNLPDSRTPEYEAQILICPPWHIKIIIMWDCFKVSCGEQGEDQINMDEWSPGFTHCSWSSERARSVSSSVTRLTGSDLGALKHSWKQDLTPLFGSDLFSSTSLFPLPNGETINPRGDANKGSVRSMSAVTVRECIRKSFNWHSLSTSSISAPAVCLGCSKGHVAMAPICIFHLPLYHVAIPHFVRLQIISFYTADFMVGFALRFTPRGCSLGKWLWFCLFAAYLWTNWAGRKVGSWKA